MRHTYPIPDNCEDIVKGEGLWNQQEHCGEQTVQSGQWIVQMKDTWNRSAGTYFGYIFIFRSISEGSSCDATKMVEVSPPWNHIGSAFI
jgi:hypothetical protein